MLMLFTPPPAPTIKTDSPAVKPPRVISECQAVTPTKPTAAASPKSKSAGISSKLRSGKTTYSAAVPL